MKITRRQLRRLIETRIKPEIPSIPSGDNYIKIDDLARTSGTNASADIIAQTFGYPSDRIYSDDLYTYDESGQFGKDMQRMRELGAKYADADTHGEPDEYYIRKEARQEASRICDSYENSREWTDHGNLLKVLVGAFTDGANEYEINRDPSSTFRYNISDIAWHLGYI